jgi:hypothetical protein
MERTAKTAECQEIAVVKVGNYTHAVDDIDLFVSQTY